MRITRITAYQVVVPARRGAIESEGLRKPLHKLPSGARDTYTIQFDELPKLLLRLDLDNGVSGWGECYRDHDWRMVEAIARALLGLRLGDFPLQRLPVAYCREYDGFECAVWDAFARAREVRLVDLLGGPVREKVWIGAWTGHRFPGEVGELARRYAALGYDCLKFKSDLEDDVAAWCREAAAAAPGMQVIIDPNERWLYPAEVRRRLDALREIGNVMCLEDPLPRWQLGEYARLRAYSSIAIVLHVSLPYLLHGQRPKDAVQALQAEAVDGFNFNGGLVGFQRLAHLAAAAGLPCWHGSELDLGILEARYLHSAAAAQTCVWPSDIFGRLIREHDLLAQPLTMEPPFATLPQGAGLGVTPDLEAIQHYQTAKQEYT
jgi:muconate cycloisomerase